ncbi:relaxase domain-containing protein [Gemmata sp. G18]|uniref:Relaxase domain-containing protein n=1 Tax=Gemmata palustris TaxID=2822762 RepID=A0ABS5BQ59_9BACT|nr:MobF family relaxase [Gemmata palustris]MBP3955445.1 relaxase domain-containing protein [Gemmata palustris]
MRDIRDAKSAASYYGKSDGGYYLGASDLRREVGGNAASLLGISGVPDPDQFKRLLQGLHPETGEQLTSKLVDGRLAGWDITASIPKGVTIAIERGDARIHDALWEAARETMAEVEGMIATRKRKGGAMEDRVTGNLMWFGFEHPETRPARSDGMPDPDRHIHLVVPNLTFDTVEGEWKAIKFRPVMELRKYFDRAFDARLARKLTDLGYGIETRMKPDGQGGKRFYTWDIKDMPKSVVEKFSRRTAEVEALAEKLGIDGPAKDKLGATSRQFKRDDMTLEDYRRYWDGRVTPDEARQVAEVIRSAMLGQNPPEKGSVREAVEYSLSHNFERRSVVAQPQVAITALERGMGVVRPEDVMPEAKRQGLLLKDGEATTRDVLAEEQKVIAFARGGRGSCRAMGNEKGRPNESERPSGRGLAPHRLDHTATPSPERQAVSAPALSPEQAVMVNHVLTSPDRVMLVVGDAGTGKTFAVRQAFQRIDRPVDIIAPGAEASRGVLRREGFQNADTVTAFLNSAQRQQAVKNGVIWVDEAGQLPIRDLSRLVAVAEAQNARLVLQGDPKQHRAVARDGNMLRVLERYAGLPVARLKDIRRQKGDYKQAVASIAAGNITDGFDKLNALGWVKQTPVFDHNQPLVDAYLEAVDTKRSDQDITDRVLAVSPTHAEANEVTAAIRDGLKQRGLLATEERTVPTLTPLHWTDAEKADLERYDGTEVVRYHRDGGTFKAGRVVAIADFKPGDRLGKPTTFAVYSPAELQLAEGDRIRITGGGWTTDKKHRLDNGAQYQVAGFEESGAIRLTNGWHIPAGFGHLAHGYVATSHSSQGKTVDRVLIAMGHESLPAITAEQFYVSVSRGRDQATVFTGMAPAVLRDAIKRADERKSATELMKPKRRREWWMARRARQVWEALRGRSKGGMSERQKQKEHSHAR